jgi:hypothetical protein
MRWTPSPTTPPTTSPCGSHPATCRRAMGHVLSQDLSRALSYARCLENSALRALPRDLQASYELYELLAPLTERCSIIDSFQGLILSLPLFVCGLCSSWPQWVHNHGLLHDRTAFTDWEDGDNAVRVRPVA